MNQLSLVSLRFGLILTLLCGASAAVRAQQPQTIVAANGAAQILSGAELARVVPTGFYFEGQSAPTQMRNAAAARFGEKRLIVAGLVDTSGYSSDVRTKYEGFLIVDSPVTIGGKQLATGAYGFGFTADGKLNIFDVGGNAVLSVDTAHDKELRRPRPLMLTSAADGVRFYAGRAFVVVSAK